MKKKNSRKKKNFKNRRRKIVSIAAFSFLLISLCFVTFKSVSFVKNKIVSSFFKVTANKTVPNKSDNKNKAVSKTPDKTIPTVEVLLSSAGDCTIGTDPNFDKETSLPTMVHRQDDDYGYLFKNALPIFGKDDITIVNLETTFTNSSAKAEKTFTFKAPPTFAKSLNLGSIEGVNLSNNHTYDFLDKGFQDTVQTLKDYKINYFGENNKWIKEVKGVKFGFLGYNGWNYDKELINKLKEDIEDLKNQNCVVVVNFHWGEEGSYNSNETQKNIAHYAIDKGADLIIGHHPHVIQGIEKYKDKFICYSLGNFCFGGNSNPSDKDTFILQAKFSFDNNKLSKYNIRVIPFSISSVNYKNDYCPTALQEGSKERVLKKLNNISKDLNFQLTDSFNE